MIILKIIHGYPPEYNAGSEVYSQTLCHELAKTHTIHVFTREENPFLPDYNLRSVPDELEVKITKHIINVPLIRQRYRYRHEAIDQSFDLLLKEIKPDIVHVGHLNHLSTSLLEKVKKRNIPIVFTLHDYWLLCPRGQFLQRNPKDPSETWTLCDGQEDRKCAERCYSGYYSGADTEKEEDSNYWTQWIARRQAHLKEMCKLVDMFIAPSQYLLERFKKELNLDPSKLLYLDYGFDLVRLNGRKRQEEQKFVFGYIGTHTAQKGIHLLLKAFEKIKGNCILRIWGRSRTEITPGLKQIAANFPVDVLNRIEWLPEYQNSHLISQVFNQADCIVVPSIWVENSPLVIHEAQQAGIPVITANEGGMREYVKHEINGLTFNFRDEESLAQQMQRLVDDPTLAKKLGESRYLYSPTGEIPSIQRHVEEIEKIYLSILFRQGSKVA